MRVEQLLQCLDRIDTARPWLTRLGIQDVRQSHQCLVSLAESGMTLDLLSGVTEQLEQWLPHTSDPDRVLLGLDRFVQSARSPISLACLFERDRESLPTLLQLLSTSQYLAELLIADPPGFDLLRLTEGSPLDRCDLTDEICSEVRHLADLGAVMNSLRHYKRREILRISYGDVIRGHDILTVTEQLSFLADALCEAALRASGYSLAQKYGQPRDERGQVVPWVVLALGKLGGNELNYSSDIDLLILYAADGYTDGDQRIDNAEFFERCARSMVHLLSETTSWGAAYRVDLRLRPYGRSGPLAMSVAAAEHYYDVSARTWERQAFVKARPAAGDHGLGSRFLERLHPWIYPCYLSRADITGIKALKRRIEHQVRITQGDHRNVKVGWGGIRDIEFVIQFLQLLHGRDLPQIRTGNTLDAIVRLESAGCLTMQERGLLEENYRFLRKVEHRLQIMYDSQTHVLPARPEELAKLALRLGYRATAKQSAQEQLESDYRHRTQVNRRILDHLLHDAFVDDEQTAPEADLVLAPEATAETVSSVLSKYSFRDLAEAYKNLSELAIEPIPFLSTRRCRHFLASIAHRLLPAIADTPDPDGTLVELNRVSQCLGGKTVLWELFSSHTPTMQLCVRLCAGARYLSGILTSHPGMIDELLDSLTLNTMPCQDTLRQELRDLCRNAVDIEPILASFKNSYHLRVGVRDLLGIDAIDSTWETLSHVAEVCLQEVIDREFQRLAVKYGQPSVERFAGVWEPSELVVIALGKLGGREPNYHSDLDVMFVYSEEGTTRHSVGTGKETTSNQHFFSELGQRIIQFVNRVGPHGRLFELDLRLRPTGQSGSLAVSRQELLRYFSAGTGQLWERMALCRARVIYGSTMATQHVMQDIRQCLFPPDGGPPDPAAIREMRRRLEESAQPHNLKRGPGGTMDIEFITQMLQLRFGEVLPTVLVPGTVPAIQALENAGYLTSGEAWAMSDAYRFLRGVEAKLRLMNTAARHDLPDDETSQKKLAYLLRMSNGPDVLDRCRTVMQANRALFDHCVSI